MKTSAPGDTLMSKDQLVDYDMLDQFFVEMSELIDTLHMEVSGFTPQFVPSYHFLRINAVKIFQNFIGDVRDLVSTAKALDAPSGVEPVSDGYVQGTLF